MDIREQYQDFDLNQEPFLRRAELDPDSFDWAYPEVDEMELIDSQENTFHPEDHYPKPPENLPENHPVVLAWKALLLAQEEMQAGVDIINTLNSEVHGKVEKVLKIPGSAPSKFLKKARVNHLQEKKDFLQKALAYLHLYNACPDTSKEPEDSELLHQVESNFIGHMVYLVVRSATHIFKPTRENGQMVMDHTYKTCVQVMNSHLARIKRTSSPAEKSALYERMNKGMIVALCHDYLEDFPEMTPQFLANKLTQHLTFDTITEASIRRSGYHIPIDTNPFTRNEASIMRLLATLTKPVKGSPNRKNYLHQRIIKENTLTEDERVVAMEVKCADRLHNLNTLGAKPLAKRINYLRETLQEIVCTTMDVLERSPEATQLRMNITNLSMTVARLALDLREQHFPEIQALGADTEANLNITIEAAKVAFQEYYSAED